MEYERVHAAALITEKRGKNFGKVLGEWQSKAADVSAEVAASQDEGRNYSSELFRLKAATDEAVEQLDIVNGRTRTSRMRSRIYLISSVREAAPSMTWTNGDVVWSKKRRSCRLLWRKLREPLSRRRIRY